MSAFGPPPHADDPDPVVEVTVYLPVTVRLMPDGSARLVLSADEVDAAVRTAGTLDGDRAAYAADLLADAVTRDDVTHVLEP